MKTEDALRLKLRTHGEKGPLPAYVVMLCQLIDAHASNLGDRVGSLERNVNGTGGNVLDGSGR